MISKKAVTRVTRLINMMKKLPRKANKHFNMSWWALHQGGGVAHWKRGDSVTREQLLTCGTTACAAGWAATDPYFKKLGLDMIAAESSAFINSNLCEVFDLSLSHEDALFGGQNEDKSPKAWAKRAEKLLKEWQKEE